MSDAALLEFVARLTYNVDGLSGKLRLYFSQFLGFHFLKTLSLNQIQDIENRKAAKPFRGEQEILAAAKDLSETEKCWAIGAIELFQMEAERLDDRVVSRRLAVIAKDLYRILELEGSSGLVGVQRNTIQGEILKYEEQPIVRIPAAIWPLSLDFVLRCAFLLYLSSQGFDQSISAEIVIPVIIFILVIYYRRRNKKVNLQLLESYGGVEKYKVEFHMSATQYTWLAFYLIASIFISYLLAGTHQFGASLHVLAFIFFPLYYSVYLRFFNVGKISENDLVRQLEQKEQRTDSLDVDENDEMLVDLETRLNASTSRLDAYVLESALFGALSFSGFLQIMASDLVSFTDLEAFASNIFTTSQAFIHLDWTGLEKGLSLLSDKVNLFCLVSVESLICSIFFIAVIASRLRFSDIADKVRTAINLAHAFNEKEEALYHESESSDVRQSRLKGLTMKVNRQLHDANQSLRRVDPVMAYMQFFRNAGILVFLIILISSSLFITSVLSWTFLAMVGATYLYFNRERIGLNVRATLLQLRILFLRWSGWLFVAALTPFVISVILRNFFSINDPEWEALGSLILGLVLPIWLLLASHFDQEFGDIESKENRSRVSRWNIVRNLIAVMLFIYCLGMCFKLLHLYFADEMIMIGMSSFTFLMYFAGYYLSKVKWLGLVSGVMMAIATTGILFKTLHLIGAREMLLIGVMGLLVFSVIFALKRKAFHSLFVRFCIVIMILAFGMWTNALLRLEMAYAHRTTDVAQFFRLLESVDDDYFSTDANAAAAVQSTEAYISRYGNAVPFHVVYGGLVRSYNELGQYGAWQFKNREAKDTTILSKALMAVRERDRILDLYDFSPGAVMTVDLGLEANILLALNRKKEAEAALNTLLDKLQWDILRNEVTEKLESLRADGSGN